MKLMDKEEATKHLALMAKTGRNLNIYLSEDICFADEQTGQKEISLGQVQFCPNAEKTVDSTGLEVYYDAESAVRFGGFVWATPSLNDLNQSIDAALPRGYSADNRERIKKAFHEGLQDVIRRTHLSLPVFDADALAALPLRRPTTIVPDTTAVHQGALDFVCRFLSPHARIKIPAIVHMEILTNADNYFKRIRFATKKADKRCAAIRQHLLSQGGQRALLRMELTPEIELERGDLGADPLRGIVTQASDSEDKNLGLQQVVASFADRLIVETARRFQFEVRPDHPLFILTSDQGMARMAIAEGLGVFFFQARSAPQVLGKLITGALHHPFSSEIYTVSLADILWELAVSFGELRISTDDQEYSLHLWGIGGDSEGVTWQPLHAKEDLLWAKVRPEPSHPTFTEVAQSVVVQEVGEVSIQKPKRGDSDLLGWYKFTIDKMLLLIEALAQRGHLSQKEAQEIMKLQSPGSCVKYERFLRSGRFVLDQGDQLVSTESLSRFWSSLDERDFQSILASLRLVPSFEMLLKYVQEKHLVPIDDPGLPVPKSARFTYLTLGEIALAWLRIIDQGIVCTHVKTPSEEDFARIAIDTYRSLSDSDGTEWVLTGKWLEQIALEHGLHPVVTKNLLAKAKDADLIRLFAEGSTPDTRFDEHFFWMLARKADVLRIDKTYLYHGDFILPGTSAVRVKIQGVDYAT